MILAVLAAAAAISTGAAEVDALSWMAGTWAQDRDGVRVRETWLPPKDGVMSGVSQTNRPGRRPFVEFMTITSEQAGATFTAILPGQPPTPFVLVPGAAGEAVFENRTHDFPRRVIYRRCGADLCARIEGEVAGKPRAEDWRYIRIN